MTGVEIQSVSVRLGDATVVKSVNVSIASVTFAAIVGPNGSGKTSLLRTIYQAVRPSAGAVCIDSADVRRMSARRAARLRAVVPQFHDATVGLTAREVVSTGRYAHTPWWGSGSTADSDATEDALAAVGADHVRDRMFGFLSGGERQRVLLARALAQQASTLLLDEPTNPLDARAQLDLLGLMHRCL